LPRIVTDALDTVNAEGKHFFRSGSSKPKSAVGDFQRSLRRLFDLAKMPHIQAHLFRHTYATELLTAGTSMETVAALLGHSSTKVTEKSYGHWVKGRQEFLEAAVKMQGPIWTQSLLILPRNIKNIEKEMVEAGESNYEVVLITRNLLKNI
jgi:hypothetical protein